MSFSNGSDITTNQANVTLSGANSNFTNFNHLADNQGSFNLSSGRTFNTLGDLTNSGQVKIDKTSKLNVNGTYTQASTGSLAGEGTLTGDANISGTIEAGDAGLTFAGNLALNSDATLKFDLGSVNILGNLTLDNANLVLNSALGNISPDHRRSIVESIIERITVGKGEIDITLYYLPSSEELVHNQQALPRR